MNRDRSGNRKVVFFGTSKSVFVTRTAEELRSRGLEVNIVDPYAGSLSLNKGILNKLLRLIYRIRYTRREIRQLDRQQTAIIHSLGIDLFWVSWLMKNRFNKVVGLAYGSDILRRNKRLDWLLNKGIKRLDEIAATNNNVHDSITESFPDVTVKKSSVIRFGLSVFDELEKINTMSTEEARVKLGYLPHKTLICLGYSASDGQRQKELIDFFAAQPGFHKKYQFVVPVQYGSAEVKLAIEEKCSSANKKIGSEIFRPLTKFHDPHTTALMRMATSVLINHSVSDAFSGTVQEVVYAGNLVLAAKHLPYEDMPGFRTAIKPYDDLDVCASVLLSDTFSKWHASAQAALPETRNELRKVSSWDGVINDWFSLIEVNA